MEGESDNSSITDGIRDVSTINQMLDKPEIELKSNSINEGVFKFPLLLQTNETWHKDNDGMDVYNTPAETGKKLDTNQGKVQGYQGTCGIVSCVNILRLAGLSDISEEQVFICCEKKRIVYKAICIKVF